MNFFLDEKRQICFFFFLFNILLVFVFLFSWNYFYEFFFFPFSNYSNNKFQVSTNDLDYLSKFLYFFELLVNGKI